MKLWPSLDEGSSVEYRKDGTYYMDLCRFGAREETKCRGMQLDLEKVWKQKRRCTRSL